VLSVLFFDCTACFPQMLPKIVGWIGRSSGKVLSELQLLAQCFAGLDSFRLAPLYLPNFACVCHYSVELVPVNENATIVVSENGISLTHFKFAKKSDTEGVFSLAVEPLRTRGARTVAKNRKSDLLELGRVAVGSPNDDSGQAAGPRFQYGEVANAAFIRPTGIIDNKDISRSPSRHGLEENIDTSEMFCRKRVSGQTTAGKEGPNPKWGEAKRQTQPQGGVHDQWR
jgi:hypothetical protein